jgi:hypothetical protein
MAYRLLFSPFSWLFPDLQETRHTRLVNIVIFKEKLNNLTSGVFVRLLPLIKKTDPATDSTGRYRYHFTKVFDKEFNLFCFFFH